MKEIIFIPLIALTIAGHSQSNLPLIKFSNPKSLSAPKGYSHAAIVDLGNCQMIILSGQVPLDSQGNLIGNGDISKQTEQVFLNIKNAITELGGTMNNIVKLGYFIVDASQIQTIREIRDKYINTNNPPASTLVQISKLFRDDILIEIEATIIIPKNKVS